MYGSISYFGKKEKVSVNPENKLPFLVDQRINKKEIQLKLTKLISKLTEFKIVETIFIKGLQNLTRQPKLY